MAHYYFEPPHTFREYMLIPLLNIPLVAAIMQPVSENKMAVALAKEGGLSFISVPGPSSPRLSWLPASKRIRPVSSSPANNKSQNISNMRS